MTQKFKRTIENFTCEHCDLEVSGNGYTNHCSRCLWSKHVDVNPGDRAAQCKGLMEPMELILDHGHYDIVHLCVRCGHRKRNHSSEADNQEALIQLGSPKK